ncbi:MAG TPA: ribulose-phosphate 3-epimerase [bacterium]|nr:ribulose-phosphate 3-epimerase [bacterium]HOL48486.1 ribulose-phosphate 3-epimerase [bacterium]HPQ19185.1 ribulose-phosphate 3-epimerase [bacterium]
MLKIFSKKKIIPSILSADFTILGEQLKEIIKAGIDVLHIDVMDGHFVPNISIGTPVIKSIKKNFPDFYLDVHLMISNPEKHIQLFSEAGADLLNIHYEISNKNQILDIIKEIRKLDKNVGLTINPDTDVKNIENYLDYLDLILIMSVFPGFGGQKFIESSIDKIKYLSEIKKKKNYKFVVEVDGGINRETIAKVKKAGADWFVIGSAIFEKPDIFNETKYYIDCIKQNEKK